MIAGGRDVLAQPRATFLARRDAEPLVPTPRPIQRVPANARCRRPRKLGTQRRRTSTFMQKALIRLSPAKEKPMCPACIATTAMLIASAVSAGGVTAVLANKLGVKEITRNIFVRQQKEKTWEPHTSK